jgi:phage gp29-like protein
MAEDQNQSQAQAVPPLPPKGQIVSEAALYQSQISLYRNSLAYGGQRDPSTIWATMVYNHPQAMLLYRELEDKDEDVANCLDTLRLSVLKRDRTLTPADESQLALDVKDFVEDEISKLTDFHAVLDCILDAPGYGFSVQELVFDSSMGQASLVGINDCPQELFLFGDRYQPQIGQLQFLTQPWASSGTPVPEEKFIVYTYRQRARNRMGRPLLKSVFWPSWFKRNIQRLWMQYAEKGPGTAVVRYNDADNVAERQRAAETAQGFIDNVAIAIPQNCNYDQEMLKIARSQDPAVYEHLFQAMQYSIARKILGETLTSFGNEGGTGSKAQGDTHADTLDTRVVEQCKAVASIINRQLVRPLVLWNYGPKAPMPKWGFDVGEEEDLKARLMVDSGLQRMGKQFTPAYVADRYDVPLVQGEDPETPLVPNPSAPQLSIPDPSGATFAEDPREAQAHREMHEFDQLFGQLKADARGILKQRIEELAHAAVPVERP